MSLRRPYYGLHQIVTGQYTSGNEYVLDDGSDYIGSYHILPNGQRFTYSVPKLTSVELFEKRNDITEMVKTYNNIIDQNISRYVSPKPYQPIPDGVDYEIGQIFRYFVQKRNNAKMTITEIDNEQFSSINLINAPGINANIWNSLIIPWKISKIPANDVSIINRRTLVAAEHNFPYIGIYLPNVLEFYR